MQMQNAIIWRNAKRELFAEKERENEDDKGSRTDKETLKDRIKRAREAERDLEKGKRNPNAERR